MSTTVQNSCELVTTIVQQGRSVSVTVVGVPGPATPGTGAGGISADPGNRATAGSEGGSYVGEALVPETLAYYILAKA